MRVLRNSSNLAHEALLFLSFLDLDLVHLRLDFSEIQAESSIYLAISFAVV